MVFSFILNDGKVLADLQSVVIARSLSKSTTLSSFLMVSNKFSIWELLSTTSIKNYLIPGYYLDYLSFSKCSLKLKCWFTRFFNKKKFIRKWGSKSQNFKKMLRKSQGSSSTVHLFYVPEIGISSFFCKLLYKDRDFSLIVYVVCENQTISHWEHITGAV